MSVLPLIILCQKPKENEQNIPSFQIRNFNEALDQIIVIRKLVGEAIDKIKSSKSQGPDNIHPFFIKQTKESIIQPLSIIFQKSIEEGKLLDDWKMANVTAIFKKDDRKLLENYRPISLTSVPGKLLERIIRDQIVNHMTSNNLFANCQHGFITGKSCTTQLLEYIENIDT